MMKTRDEIVSKEIELQKIVSKLIDLKLNCSSFSLEYIEIEHHQSKTEAGLELLSWVLGNKQ